MNRSDWLGLIPNGLSLSRVGLGLAFPLTPHALRPWLVAVAALTDMLDGLTSRWLHVESDTGRLLDPIADKFFALMLAGTVVAEGTIELWWAVGIGARDLVVLAGAAATALRRRWAAFLNMPPTWPGKCTTAAQFLVFLIAVVEGQVAVWLMAVTTMLSVAAALHYSALFIERWNRPLPGA